MPILINTNTRATLVEGVNINQGKDFSDSGTGMCTNVEGFVDDFAMLDLTIAGTLNFTSGYCWVRYQKDDEKLQNANIYHYMKCELTVPANIADPGGNYFVYIEVVPAILTTGSAEVDGTDYFTISYATTLPATGYFIPLYEVNGGVIANDLRVKRNIDVGQLDVQTSNVSGNQTVGGNQMVDGNHNVMGNSTVMGTMTATEVNTPEINVTDLNVTNPPTLPAGTQIGGEVPASIATTAEAIAGTLATKAISVKDAKELHGEYQYVAGATEVFASTGVGSNTSLPYVEVKACVVNKGGTYTVEYEMMGNSTDGNDHQSNIYVNGNIVGTNRSNNTATWILYTEDISLAPGDRLSVYAKGDNSPARTTSVRNLKLKGTKVFTGDAYQVL